MLSRGETLASLSSEASGRIPVHVHPTYNPHSHPHNPHLCAQAHTLVSLVGGLTSTSAHPGQRPGWATQGQEGLCSKLQLALYSRSPCLFLLLFNFYMFTTLFKSWKVENVKEKSHLESCHLLWTACLCSMLPPPPPPSNSVVETLITNLKGLGRSGLREVIRSIGWAPTMGFMP